jgi:hypothetical protein
MILAETFGCRITCVEKAEEFDSAARRRAHEAGLDSLRKRLGPNGYATISGYNTLAPHRLDSRGRLSSTKSTGNCTQKLDRTPADTLASRHDEGTQANEPLQGQPTFRSSILKNAVIFDFNRCRRAVRPCTHTR